MNRQLSAQLIKHKSCAIQPQRPRFPDIYEGRRLSLHNISIILCCTLQAVTHHPPYWRRCAIVVTLSQIFSESSTVLSAILYVHKTLDSLSQLLRHTIKQRHLVVTLRPLPCYGMSYSTDTVSRASRPTPLSNRVHSRYPLLYLCSNIIVSGITSNLAAMLSHLLNHYPKRQHNLIYYP